MVDSLREYIDLLRAKGLLLEIDETVQREDVPALIEKLSPRRKALLFNRVAGYNCRIATNLVPSHEVFRDLFEADNPYEAFLSGVRTLQAKVPVERPRFETIDVKGRDLLKILPLLMHYVHDSAPYITTSIVSSPDPDSGQVGRGIHRMEFRGRNTLGVSLINPPLKDIADKYRARGQRMPLAATVGIDPVFFLSMAMKVPLETDKLKVTGGLKGKGVEVMPAFDAPIDVPARGEYLLEGYIEPKPGRQDGPLGEISGYYLTVKETPTFTVERISHLPDPIYHALLPTSMEANMILTFVSRAHVEDSMKKLHPFVSGLTFVDKTFGSSVVVTVKPVEKTKIRNLMLFLLSFPMIKKAVIVDEDIDPENLADVEWAVVTRCRAEEDMVIAPGLQGQPIDPQAGEGHAVTKIAINATTQGKSMEERALVSKGNAANIEKVLKSLEVCVG
jgi:2,5-furandicarboxylate decarboxylase 1